MIKAIFPLAVVSLLLLCLAALAYAYFSAVTNATQTHARTNTARGRIAMNRTVKFALILASAAILLYAAAIYLLIHSVVRVVERSLGG